MWRCRKMEAHSLSQMLIQCSDLLQKREKILWYCCQMQLFRHSKANSARTIPIDWKRDYYRLKWPSNEGTRFGSIGKHLERNNGSRNAGDGISLIESRSSRKNNNIISTLVGGCQIQCMGRFYEGGRAKRSETFMQIWSTWKTRSPVDFLHKAQKWFSMSELGGVCGYVGYRYHSTKYEQQHLWYLESKRRWLKRHHDRSLVLNCVIHGQDVAQAATTYSGRIIFHWKP